MYGHMQNKGTRKPEARPIILTSILCSFLEQILKDIIKHIEMNGKWNIMYLCSTSTLAKVDYVKLILHLFIIGYLSSLIRAKQWN